VEGFKEGNEWGENKELVSWNRGLEYNKWEKKSSFGMMFGGMMNPSCKITQDYTKILWIKMLKLEI